MAHLALEKGAPKYSPFSNHLFTKSPQTDSFEIGKIWMYLESVDAFGTEKTHKRKRKTWLCSHLFPVEFTA